MAKRFLVALALVCTFSTTTLAGQNAGFKVALHVMKHGSRTCTRSFPVLTSCRDIVTTYTPESYPPMPNTDDIDVFPIFFNLAQVRALQYGLTWPLDWCSGAYQACADLSVGAIQWPGDGVVSSWNTCRVTPLIIAGFCWLCPTTLGIVELVSFPWDPDPRPVAVCDCQDPAQTDYPVAVYRVGVGVPGDNPCEPMENKPSTWGQIKATFKD